MSVHRPFVDTADLEILAPASRYSYQLYEYRKYTESLPGVEEAKHRWEVIICRYKPCIGWIFKASLLKHLILAAS